MHIQVQIPTSAQSPNANTYTGTDKDTAKIHISGYLGLYLTELVSAVIVGTPLWESSISNLEKQQDLPSEQQAPLSLEKQHPFVSEQQHPSRSLQKNPPRSPQQHPSRSEHTTPPRLE
ncbi:hypothetical protein CI102_11270 [Trichoderma harzianum]|uniref:Uncharacterized protein n=1 Tax=Trichoderma harzianum CBS 226.95 TaxID=983964 RepID=A0A2T3ZZ33_TRIHA|nr:hypothetical protein M431DRAFT_486050 [Trichoderma harzianum CBS 226.95]PKK44235.1 hypothetical protein CI102_11270 [Trichoderma harzianum]PTB50071.1 hypothetical protein M431DRAFT_486050 [Trichoderma harzianum CBS 226.95]